jgi:hypothetical protein
VIGAYHRSVAALIEAPPRRAAGGRDHYSGGVVMGWRLCTDAAAYEAALSRTFGAAAPPTRPAPTAPATDRGPITLYIRLLSRKTRPRARGSWKNRVRPQRRHKAATALTSLAERPVLAATGLNYSVSRPPEKPSKTAANCDSSLYRSEKFASDAEGKNLAVVRAVLSRMIRARR